MHERITHDVIEAEYQEMPDNSIQPDSIELTVEHDGQEPTATVDEKDDAWEEALAGYEEDGLETARVLWQGSPLSERTSATVVGINGDGE